MKTPGRTLHRPLLSAPEHSLNSPAHVASLALGFLTKQFAPPRPFRIHFSSDISSLAHGPQVNVANVTTRRPLLIRVQPLHTPSTPPSPSPPRNPPPHTSHPAPIVIFATKCIIRRRIRLVKRAAATWLALCSQALAAVRHASYQRTRRVFSWWKTAAAKQKAVRIQFRGLAYRRYR